MAQERLNQVSGGLRDYFGNLSASEAAQKFHIALGFTDPGLAEQYIERIYDGILDIDFREEISENQLKDLERRLRSLNVPKELPFVQRLIETNPFIFKYFVQPGQVRWHSGV